MAGVEPRFVDVSDKITDEYTAVDYIWLTNMCRTHYQPDQLAMIAARLKAAEAVDWSNTPQTENAI